MSTELQLLGSHIQKMLAVKMAAACVDGHPARRLSELGIGPKPLTTQDRDWDSAHDRISVRIGQTIGVFTRGMFAELAVALNDWYAFAPIAFEPWPPKLAPLSMRQVFGSSQDLLAPPGN